MRKLFLILVTSFLLISNLIIPSTVLSEDKGPPKPKEWKGEGTKIEFPSLPTLTIKDFLEGKKPEIQITICGT